MNNEKMPEWAGACYGGVINFKFLRLNTLKRLAGFYGLKTGLKTFDGQTIFCIYSGCVTYWACPLNWFLKMELKQFVRKMQKLQKINER